MCLSHVHAYNLNYWHAVALPDVEEIAFRPVINTNIILQSTNISHRKLETQEEIEKENKILGQTCWGNANCNGI